VLAVSAALFGVAAFVLLTPLYASGGGVSFDQRPSNAVVIQTPVYRLTISKRNGALLELRDRGTGLRVVDGTSGCEWGAVVYSAHVGGCLLAQHGSFLYRWDRATTTLTMTYRAGPHTVRQVDAVVTLHALRSYLDLRLSLANHSPADIQTVNFPVDLKEDVKLVRSGYAPNFLPGVRFTPRFFRRESNDTFTYPSRGAFADYVALDLGRAHLAVYSVNPAPAPLAPVELGFVHNQTPYTCSGSVFCVTHAFATWIRRGDQWTSPVVRVRVGEPVEQSILNYRRENGIDAYRSAAAKLGGQFGTLAQAPLVKIDPGKGLPPFREWEPSLRRLPSPSLLHPVAFQAGGFDANDPDFLPPDPRWGTQDEFVQVIDQAHALGQLVMPYLNVSWWDPGSPTVRTLPAGQTLRTISVQDFKGRAESEQFGNHTGYVVSPYVPFVRQRVASLLGEFSTSDCLFFDQIGSRTWLYDFNPASPTPLAYDDGWLNLLATYQDRCLMVEDGWDRLASVSSGFDGSLMLMQRALHYPDTQWGAGNWQTFPLALWLFHDKVLLYQHDLYEGTLTTDPAILTWNLAYGFMLSYTWDVWAHSLDNPWLGIVGAFQHALGPHYAGATLTSYRQIADGVTETRFGTYAVVANRTGSVYQTGGYRIAPGGFLARTDDGSLVAGEFADTAGAQYRIVEGGKTTFSSAVPARG